MDCGGRKIGLQPAAPAGWSPNRSAAGAARAESPGRGVGGNPAGLRNASEGIASLVFGGAGGAPAHMPVLLRGRKRVLVMRFSLDNGAVH